MREEDYYPILHDSLDLFNQRRVEQLIRKLKDATGLKTKDLQALFNQMNIDVYNRRLSDSTGSNDYTLSESETKKAKKYFEIMRFPAFGNFCMFWS